MHVSCSSQSNTDCSLHKSENRKRGQSTTLTLKQAQVLNRV